MAKTIAGQLDIRLLKNEEDWLAFQYLRLLHYMSILKLLVPHMKKNHYVGSVLLLSVRSLQIAS